MKIIPKKKPERNYNFNTCMDTTDEPVRCENITEAECSWKDGGGDYKKCPEYLKHKIVNENNVGFNSGRQAVIDFLPDENEICSIIELTDSGNSELTVSEVNEVAKAIYKRIRGETYE